MTDEIAAFLLARDERGELFESLAMEWARSFIDENKSAEHEGDCPHASNPAPFTCSRCVCDQAFEDARAIAALTTGQQK